jgi:hypothetical protein
MKLIALALLSATFALANPVPVAEEAAAIDVEKRNGFGVGGIGGASTIGCGTGFFPPEAFFNNNFFNTAAQNQVAFQDNDRFRENVDAQHNTALNSNTAANTAAANTAAAIVRRELELQRRQLGGIGFGNFGFPFFTTDANFFNTAAQNQLAFQNNDRFRENIDAQHNTALNAKNAAATTAANTAAAIVRRHLMELQRRDAVLGGYGAVPPSFGLSGLGSGLASGYDTNNFASFIPGFGGPVTFGSPASFGGGAPVGAPVVN